MPASVRAADLAGSPARAGVRSPVQLIRRGASLPEVTDMLRHRSRASTMIYAKLDIDGLRSVAQPWPVKGGAQ